MLLLSVLLGCTGTVDLDVVVIDGDGLAVSAARADVDQIVLTSCNGYEEAYALGYAFDLRSPSPVRIADRRWCGAEVRFMDTRRPLVLRGRTDAGTEFDALLTPSSAELTAVDVGGRGDELVLLLHADRMLPDADVDALAAGEEDGHVRIGAESPLGIDATERLPGSLQLITLPEALALPAFPYPEDWFVEPQPIETAWPDEETGDTGPWVDTSVTWYTDTGMARAPGRGCSGSAPSSDTGIADTDEPSPAPDTDTGSGDGGGGGCSCDDDDPADTADTAESASLGSRGGGLALLLLFWRRRRGAGPS
jgi:hypothetical protein